jgi:hypothetical protein
MNGTEILLTIILVILAVIAAELAVLIRDSPRRTSPRSPEKDTREVPASGQTINVNLSPMQAIPQDAIAPKKTTVVVAGGEVALGTEPAAKRDREEESAAEEQSKIARKAASSAPHAVKCPRCGAENSSYRSECFSCGGSL